MVIRYVGKELPAGVEFARCRGADGTTADAAAGDDVADVNAAPVPAAARAPAPEPARPTALADVDVDVQAAGEPGPALPAGDGPATAAAGLAAEAGPEYERKVPEGADRPQTDEEYSRTLRHRQVAGLGPEWTYTETSGGDVTLWYRKATRAGGARSAWPKSVWVPTAPQGWGIQGGPQPSRAKALRAAAADFERRRRKVTLAGPDVPLPGADGWKLRQTLADKDARTWQVIAPDDTAAGTVRPSWSGARSWSASLGDPAGEYYHFSVTPSEGERDLAAGDGEDWKTRDAAAYAVAYEHDPDSAPTAAEAMARAATERQRRKALRAPTG